MDSICQEIGISAQHVCETTVPGRYQLICDKQWLQTLERRRKIRDFPFIAQIYSRAHPTGPLKHPWTRILVQTYRKQPHSKVFPLPRYASVNRVSNDVNDVPLTYSQATSYVTALNFKNLWEAAYKRHQAAHVKFCKQGEAKAMNSPCCELLPYDVVLKELIQRIFHCPVIHGKLDQLGDEPSENLPVGDLTSCHPNVLPAIIAIETSAHISVFFYPPAVVTSVYDCITYSPSVFGKSYNKPLFIIYQILQLMKALHSEGIFLGEVQLHDILMSGNLWVQIVPRLEANLLQDRTDSVQTPSEVADIGADNAGDIDSYEDSKFDLKFAYDLDQFSLREYCEMWCNGQLSNYDYLTVLNNASGRRLNDPAHHHIMPWVTDFSTRNGANWRDLSKSKYRLNKGDVHLDLVFSHAVQQNALTGKSGGSGQDLGSHMPVQEVPHHVADFLSEITYFVYTARRTPQHILCEHVRPIWVPAEYPVSIQRLQEWTPDECIPEFYADPMIFKSIHEDLPDLGLPTWASCPEDFICKHREALESQYVSERLQNWIDLNFGYKLAGKAAIKAKNVCLSMVDQHKNICQHGIVQLFTQPHPPKRFPSPWFSKNAPRLSLLNPSTQRQSPKTKHKLTPKETRRLAKSTENLSTIDGSPNRTVTNDELSATANFYQTTNFIELPKDYNPSALLQYLETMELFFARTFPKQKANTNTHEKMVNSDLLFEENSEEHSFTNQLFADSRDVTSNGKSHNGAKPKSLLAPCQLNLKKRTLQHMLSDKKEREMQLIGCLIVELFAMHRLRPMLMQDYKASYGKRVKACTTVAELFKNEIPKCVRYVVRLLLRLEPQQLVTEKGLPPPTASQILEPIFANVLIAFPCNYYAVYTLIRALHSFDFDATLLELQTHFNCNGKDCAQYTEIDSQRVLFERKIAECKVMSCYAQIGRLLEPIAYEQFSAVELLLPHVIDLLKDEQTSILTAWNLFDPVAQALGINKTQKYLLLPIMKLYDVECFERGMISVRTRTYDVVGQQRNATSSSFQSRKSVKLYHHSFLLRLIVRFGLKCFLKNFIAPLIEAVGGYKDPEDGNGFHCHNDISNDSTRRTSKILNYNTSAEVNALTLTIPTDEPAVPTKQDIEEVFSFDEDANSDYVSNSGTAENKSIDSFDMRPTPAEEAKEAYNTQMEITPEQLAISELIYGSNEDVDKLSVQDQTGEESPPPTQPLLGPKSPTIAIPEITFPRTYQLSTIDCDIGSRKSVDSFEIITKAVEEQQRQLNTETISASNLSESQEACDSLQASVISKICEAKAVQNNRISEMSAKSLVWLSHRLGPALTSRYITRNLLKMLSLCYVGQENLLPETGDKEEMSNLNYFSIADARVVGDRSAVRVLECLMSIAALFGEEVILLQYFPHISELVALSTKRVTANLEGAIISSLQLLKYILPCLMDVTLMEHLKDIVLNGIILPIVRLLGSARLLMPSGYLGRSVLARKLLDAIYVLCIRIGPDMSKEHLCISVLRPFFLIFDKAYGVKDFFTPSSSNTAISPPNIDYDESESRYQRENEEIRDVFGPALAHTAYLAFIRSLGEAIVQRSLLNLEFILTLCHEFEQPNYKSSELPGRHGSDTIDCPTDYGDTSKEPNAANSFGTHIIGNRIEVATKPEIGPMEVFDMVAFKFDQIPTSRHLRGNWLAYWRHEISRADKEPTLNLKQIKLQSFIGHTNSVRAILALDNENSFISASKDKTVKLWSLRSEGDGTKVTPCQFTYTSHKKSIHSVSFLEAMRLVVSCDTGVHIWDPFIGRPLSILDAPKHSAITVVKSFHSPSPLVVAGTAESSVKILDTRCMQYVCEWRLCPSSHTNATVRCLTVAPSSNWMAAGLSSGSIVTLDTRTGMVINSWRPMECDLLQLATPNDHQLVSSALDHSLAVWHANDGILHYQLKPPPEPAHFLQTIDSELIFATTGNRIGVYSDITSSHAHHSVTKLRPETFRGVLTSLAVLPLNRAFLAGNESGNIMLLC